jgi:nucleotide-binding universal stress UspA family protein
VEELEMKASKAATERMQKQINKVAKSMQVEIIPEIRKGTPAKEILEAQQKNRIDLLVIASHGMTGILSHLGSVAEKVARQAKCPVYIVRSK